MGKSSGAEKVNTDPWKTQQPYLGAGFEGAANLYGQGAGGYFPNPTYVPFSGQTEQALGQTEARAGGSPVEGSLNNYITSTLGQQGPNLGGTYDTLNRLQQPQQGMRPMGLQGASQFAGNMSANPLSMSTLSNTANGSMLNSNPYLDQTFNRASQAVGQQFNEQTMPGINATFGSGGRTGSDLHADAVGRAGRDLGGTLGNLATDIYGGNYATERQNQLGAANSLDAIGRGWSADDISRKGLAANLYGADQDRALQGEQIRGNLALGATSQMGDLYNTNQNARAGAASLAPVASALDWGNIDRLAGVGTAVEGQGRDMLADQMNRYNYNQGAGWDNLSKYMAAVGGGNYGSSQTTDVNSNPIAGAAGGGLTGYAGGAALQKLLGSGAWGGNLGPWGAGLGALAGLLGNR